MKIRLSNHIIYCNAVIFLNCIKKTILTCPLSVPMVGMCGEACDPDCGFTCCMVAHMGLVV